MRELLFMKPCFSHTIWGGTRLRDVFGYDEHGDDIGECWGISAHPGGDDTITGGQYDGKKLSEVYFHTLNCSVILTVTGSRFLLR